MIYSLVFVMSVCVSGSPERRQLSFSVTQSFKKSPYMMDSMSAHDSIAPGSANS